MSFTRSLTRLLRLQRPLTVALCAIVIAACTSSSDQSDTTDTSASGGSSSGSTGTHPVSVVQLRELQSQDGAFTIGIPSQGNWQISESPIGDIPFASKIVIDSGEGPQAFFYILLPVSDLSAGIAAKQLPCVAQAGSLFSDNAACALQIAQLQGQAGAKAWSGTDGA